MPRGKILLERETITVEEAARLLGIGRRNAYDRVKDGTIPSIRFGARVVVPLAALRRLLADAGRA